MIKGKGNKLPKTERLCSRYLIDKLFEVGSGSSVSAYPLRLVYRIADKPESGLHRGNDADAILISVPKRYFKHAVDRNKVKRQVREAYRQNKSLISLPEGKVAHMAFIWLAGKHYATNVVEKKVCNLMQRMTEKVKR